jgi:hypothetical protein
METTKQKEDMRGKPKPEEKEGMPQGAERNGKREQPTVQSNKQLELILA